MPMSMFVLGLYVGVMLVLLYITINMMYILFFYEIKVTLIFCLGPKGLRDSKTSLSFHVDI